MFKNILFVLVLGLLVATPATAMAAVDWIGMTTDWDDIATNWAGDPDGSGYKTEQANVDPDDVALLGGTEMPVIDDTNNTAWGIARIRRGGSVTQTGGVHEWLNGSGWSSFGFNMYDDNGSGDTTLHMTGGLHITDRAAIGMKGLYVNTSTQNLPPTPAGVGILNIWGTAEFRIRENPLAGGMPELSGCYDLAINEEVGNASVIDIRDDGVLSVPAPLQAKVDDYIAAGKIVAGEGGAFWLYTVTVGDTYIVTATNEVPIPGDADRDRDVDDDDATILASNWLTATGAGWSDGDFNYDGAVNEEDASMLAANYGITPPPASSVPEPGTLLLLCLGLGSLALVRRR